MLQLFFYLLEKNSLVKPQNNSSLFPNEILAIKFAWLVGPNGAQNPFPQYSFYFNFIIEWQVNLPATDSTSPNNGTMWIIRARCVRLFPSMSICIKFMCRKRFL